MTTFDLIITIMVSASMIMIAVAAGGLLQYHYTFKESKKIDDYLADLYYHIDRLQQTNQALMISHKNLENRIQSINESIASMEHEMFDPEITAEMPIYKPSKTAELPVYESNNDSDFEPMYNNSDSEDW